MPVIKSFAIVFYFLLFVWIFSRLITDWSQKGSAEESKKLRFQINEWSVTKI